MNIKKAIAAFRIRLRKLKLQASEELITNGRTRRYRRLFKIIEALKWDLAELEYLNTPDTFPRVGFVADPEPDTKTGFSVEASAEIDSYEEWDDEEWDDEDDGDEGTDIYCSTDQKRQRCGF